MDIVSKIPMVSDVDTSEPIILEDEVYFKNDFEAFGSDFIRKFYYVEDQRLIYFFDGHLHVYNGICYEKQTTRNSQTLRRKIREYVKTLKLMDERRKSVLTPTSKSFYTNFEDALMRLSEITEEEAKKFKTHPSYLVFGKTKIWNSSTDTFHPYNCTIFNTYTLEFDVADADEEPEVWKEFFEAAGMDENQQLAWWYQRSVILMRDRKHNRLFYNFGNPRSGKGLTTAIDVAFFGRDKTATIPRRLGKHSMAPLVGKPLLLINDMKFDRHINSDFIQFLLNCAGEDYVSVEAKYKDAYDYMLEGNLVISSNEPPNFRGNLSGLENKFVFNVFRRTKEIDPTLKSRMLDTMPYIIRKAARIYPEVVNSGYDFDTERGLTMARQLLEASSVVKRYVDDACTLGEDCQIRTLLLFQHFREYARDRGEHLPTLSQFEDELITSFLGIVTKIRVRESNGRFTYFKGICKTPPPSPEKEEEEIPM